MYESDINLARQRYDLKRWKHVGLLRGSIRLGALTKLSAFLRSAYRPGRGERISNIGLLRRMRKIGATPSGNS